LQTGEHNTEILAAEGLQASLEVVETRVFYSGGRWVVQFKTLSMPTPGLWRYPSEQEAREAERRLNPWAKTEQRIM